MLNLRKATNQQLKDLWKLPIERQTTGPDKGVITLECVNLRNAVMREWCTNRGLHLFDLDC